MFNRPSIRFLTPFNSLIALICVLLFVWNSFPFPGRFDQEHMPPSLELVIDPLDSALLYDRPHAFEILGQIVRTYGTEVLSHPPQIIPAEEAALLKEFAFTPYWQGGYLLLVHALTGKHRVEAPLLFEKISHGQVWRLFTPILLHAGLLHLFFNLIWLIVLGAQLETRLGFWRYLLFLGIVAAISNTAQYLMSGFHFLGLSGVVCGMVAFIFVRQRKAQEEYQFERATYTLVSIYVLAFLLFQLISFFLEISGFTFYFPMRVANTAHLVGAATGYLLGHLKLFRSRSKLIEE